MSSYTHVHGVAAEDGESGAMGGQCGGGWAQGADQNEATKGSYQSCSFLFALSLAAR